MSDMPRQTAPQPAPLDARHTLTVRDVERMFAEAGLQRSRRTVLRLCQSAALDAVKISGPSGDEWYVSPESVPKAIGDLRQMDAQRDRRSQTQPAVSLFDADEKTMKDNVDTSRHSAPQPDVTMSEPKEEKTAPQPVGVRQGLSETDIYEHPYVRKLEARVEIFEKKYDAQVRRTEEIQIQNQQMLIDLQRMTAVGNSQTLADFMLKAKEWMLGAGPAKTEPETPVTTAS